MSSLSVANRKGYAGYEFDEAARVYHVRHRVYMPDNGKWSRRDPLGYVDGMGLYEYVESQPAALSDFAGLWSNFSFVYHYLYGAGATINLDAVGLGAQYRANTAVRAAVSLATADAEARADGAAFALMADLPCKPDRYGYGCGACIYTRVPLNGTFEPINERAFVAAGLAGAATSRLDPFDYFWLVDWTYSVGGHLLYKEMHCQLCATCCFAGFPFLRAYSYKCSLDFSVDDPFQDPSNLLGALADAIFRINRSRMPRWAILKVLQAMIPPRVPGTPYQVTYAFSIPLWKEKVFAGYNDTTACCN
jgi:RHS repeat-associated protein